MRSMQRLSMRNVSLEGVFPVMAEGMLPSLTTLRHDDNVFTGSLPDEIGWHRELEVLTLSGNAQLGEEAPPDIGYLTALKVLDLSECGFEGANSSGKFGWTYETALLEEIYINGNNFTGDIADEFGEWKNLKMLRFDRNDITDVPDEVCDLGLTELIGGCDLSCDCCTDADVCN